jgi:hypothetical protein
MKPHQSDPDNLQAYLSVAGLYRTQAEAAWQDSQRIEQKAINTLTN